MNFHLSAITLDKASVVQRSRAIEQEREVVILDLLIAGAAGSYAQRQDDSTKGSE